MAGDRAEARLSALEDSPEIVELKPEIDPKVCHICKTPYERHFGPTGPAKCWGKASQTLIQELRELVSATRGELRAERTEAKDREARLRNRLDEVTAQLSACQAAVDELQTQMVKLQASSSAEPSLPSSSRTTGAAKSKRQRKKERASRVASAGASDRDYVPAWAERSVEELSSGDEGGEEREDRHGHASSARESEGGGRTTSTHSTYGATSKARTTVNRQLQPKNSAGNSASHSQEAAEASHAARSTHRTSSTDTRTRQQRQIQYTLPCWETDQDDEEAGEDDSASWRLVSDKKPGRKKSVLYVGNLPADTTDDKVAAFIAKRSAEAGLKRPPKLYTCTVLKKKPDDGQSSRLGAHVTTTTDACSLLCDPQFWPRPLYARPWVFKQRTTAAAGGAPAAAASSAATADAAPSTAS